MELAMTGGANRDRTGNLLVANQALSQLSYSPVDPVVHRSVPRSHLKNVWA